MDDRNQGIFSPKLEHFLKIFKKNWVDLPSSPPSSYAAEFFDLLFWNKLIILFQ